MKNITFEKAMENLEKIVEELEAKDFSLDNSIKKYEEGIKLVNYCQGSLEKAKGKIELLKKDKNKDFNKDMFDTGE
jgi:exodeoxyribonuclease VII small subunit